MYSQGAKSIAIKLCTVRPMLFVASAFFANLDSCLHSYSPTLKLKELLMTSLSIMAFRPYTHS